MSTGGYAHNVSDASRPPEGTIALLFTDIEGSTRLATLLGDNWKAVLAEHHALVSDAIRAEGGYVDGTEGDAGTPVRRASRQRRAGDVRPAGGRECARCAGS
jgi:class 3 adenylate cyclase